MYFISFPELLRGNGKVFPGGEQYERYRRILSEIVTESKTECEIGTHSARKGASTHTTSGSTACPSSQATNLRAGWSMGKVHDTYYRYESAGDQYVGRTVAGLPIDSPSFAMLPPFFEDIEEHVLEASLRSCFGEFDNSLKSITKMLLASLVHHSDYIRHTCPSNSKIFLTPLFRDQAMLNNLKTYVKCRIAKENDVMRPTGVPPHVSILGQMHGMLATLNDLPQKINSGLIEILEERAIGAGAVTRDGLLELLNIALRDAGVIRLVERMENPSDSSESSEALNVELFLVDGSYRRVPADFTIPGIDCMLAYQLWWCGNPSKNYPAHKIIAPKDIIGRTQQKRFSEFKTLMSIYDAEAERQGLNIAVGMSVSEVNQVFDQVKGVVQIPDVTAKNRKRRVAQLDWRTVLNIHRKSRRILDEVIDGAADYTREREEVGGNEI
jgi:hypothetical protein